MPVLLKAMGEKDTRHIVIRALGRIKDERAAEPSPRVWRITLTGVKRKPRSKT